MHGIGRRDLCENEAEASCNAPTFELVNEEYCCYCSATTNTMGVGKAGDEVKSGSDYSATPSTAL